MVRRRSQFSQPHQRLARYEKSNASRSSQPWNRPVGTEARPPKSSEFLPPHSIAVSVTTISKDADKRGLGTDLVFESFAIDLAAIVFGKRTDELDPAWVFVDCDVVLHELFDLVGKLISTFETFTQHHKRFRLHQTVCFMPYHGTLQNRLVLQ